MAVRGAVCKPLRRITFHRRHLCSLTGAGSEVSVDDSRVQVSVDDSRVQELLLRMTGMDLDRVFLARKEPLTLPRYKLMDAEQLKKVHAETFSLARELLKMPPVLPERAPRGEVIERDDKLAGAIQHKMIFTDITHHKEDKSRRIVVRELNGILREATWEERDRMCQVYFPKLGRRLWLPAMLERKHLPALLKEDRHLHVLDLTCAQCAPDSADYIRVHKDVYEDIERRGLYDVLRSTQHFGGMVWFLMSRNEVDELLKDMLTRQLVSDASDLVELHLLCHPNSTFATELQNRRERPTGRQLVEVYCIHHQLTVEQELLQASDHKSVEGKTEATLAS